MAALAKTLTGEAPGEYLIRAKNGVERWIRSTGRPVLEGGCP